MTLRPHLEARQFSRCSLTSQELIHNYRYSVGLNSGLYGNTDTFNFRRRFYGLNMCSSFDEAVTKCVWDFQHSVTHLRSHSRCRSRDDASRMKFGASIKQDINGWISWPINWPPVTWPPGLVFDVTEQGALLGSVICETFESCVPRRCFFLYSVRYCCCVVCSVNERIWAGFYYKISRERVNRVSLTDVKIRIYVSARFESCNFLRRSETNYNLSDWQIPCPCVHVRVCVGCSLRLSLQVRQLICSSYHQYNSA